MNEATPTGILGRTDNGRGDQVHLDIEALIGSHLCIVANSGGGKSGLIRRLLETTYGRIQHIVLDGEDEFYTLRERYSYVIAGGDGGDCPATVATAKDLALGALTHGFSLIAQLNDLGPDGAPDFIGRFLSAMIHSPRDLWHPVLVVVDELQRFAPRQGYSAATDGIKALLSQGRKRGFTAIGAGTKMTEIDPAIRGGFNNWILGRTGQTIDRNAAAEALGFTQKEGRERLRGMAPRLFYAFGPAIAPEPVLFRVDDAETTVVKAGQAKVPTPPAPEALREILSGLAKPEPAADGAEPAGAAEIRDPDPALVEENEQLRGQIGGLEQDLDQERERGVDLEQQLVERGRAMLAEAKQINDAARTMAGRQEEFFTLLAEVERITAEAIERGVGIEEFARSLEKLAPPAPPAATLAQGGGFENEAKTHVSARARPGIDRPRTAAPPPAGPPPEGVSKKAADMIEMLDRIAPAKVTFPQLAAMIGGKASGGTYNTACRDVRASGRAIELGGGFVQSALPQRRGMTREAAIALWKGVLDRLGGKAGAMFEALVAYGRAMTKDELAEAVGIVARGGNWTSNFGHLRKNGLIEPVSETEWSLPAKLPGER